MGHAMAMLFRKRSCIGYLILFSSSAFSQSVTITAVNSSCPEQGQIITKTTGFTGTVGYQLRQGADIVRPTGGSGFQASNTFENLPHGTYTVVADDGRSSIESAPASVVVNYQKVTTSVAPATILCKAGTGVLHVAASGGTGQFLYAITSENDVVLPPNSSFQESPDFSGLKVGAYKFWTKDKSCATATVVITTGAVNYIGANDAADYNMGATLEFNTNNTQIGGFSVLVGRPSSSNGAITQDMANDFTIEVLDVTTGMVYGPIPAVAAAHTFTLSTDGGVDYSQHSLKAILRNTCTGTFHEFNVSKPGPGLSAFATCPSPQSYYRLPTNALITFPATISYVNKDVTGIGNQSIVRTVANNNYIYVDFPAGEDFDWTVTDANGRIFSGTHIFSKDLTASGPVQTGSSRNNCVLSEGTISVRLPGVRHPQIATYTITSVPPGAETLLGHTEEMVQGATTDYTLKNNGSNYFPAGKYKILINTIGAICYVAKEIEVTVNGWMANVASVTTTANCGSFSFKAVGNFEFNPAVYEVVIVSGPAGTAGLVRQAISETETGIFNNMPYGTYQLALRYRTSTSCTFSTVPPFTFVEENSIDFDAINSGGFTCGPDRTGNLLIVASTTIKGSALEYSIDEGTTWQVSNIFPNKKEQVYKVLIRDTQCGNQKTVFAAVISELSATINNRSGTQTICEGSAIVLNVNAIGGTKYTWTYPDGSKHDGKIQNISNLSAEMAGIYTVVVETGSCVAPPQSVTLQVSTNPQINTIDAVNTCNNTQVMIPVSGKGGSIYTTSTMVSENPFSYSWTNDNPAIGLAASGNGPIAFTATNGSLTAIKANITVSTAGSCKGAEVKFEVTVNPSPTISLTSDVKTLNQEVCPGFEITPITFAVMNSSSVSITGLPDGFSGEMTTGIYTIRGKSFNPGVYKYQITSGVNNCNATAEGVITVNPLPIAAITSSGGNNISKGDVIILTSTVSDSYVWTGPDIISGFTSQSVSIRPRETATYNLQITSNTGCMAVSSITIQVKEDLKLIPNNVITPNGNGKNDVWIIQNIDYYPNNKVQVFDRAGRIVFSTSNYKNDWDATYNGIPLAQAAYFYVIDMGKGYGLIRGTVNVIRD